MLAVGAAGALAQAQDLEAAARRVRQGIVAERYGGVDPCGTLNPIASVATFADAPPDCKALGEEMLRRLQAIAADGTSARPRTPLSTGTDAGVPGSSSTDADAETALLDALRGGEDRNDEYRKIFSSREAEKSRVAAIQEGRDARAGLLERLLDASPGASREDVENAFGPALNQIQSLAMTAALEDADGTPLFRATRGMLSVAAKLAQASGSNPDALVALQRLRAMLMRRDLDALRLRPFTPPNQ